jgi:hypothetical protein
MINCGEKGSKLALNKTGNITHTNSIMPLENPALNYSAFPRNLETYQFLC